MLSTANNQTENSAAVSCHIYLVVKIIVAIVKIIMAKPPLVLHMDMMLELVGLGLLQLHKHTQVQLV